MSLLSDLAKAKRLPVEFLAGLGLVDTEQGINIPYRLMDGSLAPRQRLRIGLSAKDGFRWTGPKGIALVPYGLDRLSQDHVVMVEGESDCWTLWFHGLPALGLPGATLHGAILKEHLANIAKIYCWREPDGGGDQFIKGMARRAHDLKWPGELVEIKIGGIKDPSDLHCRYPLDFKKTMLNLMSQARPIPAYIPPKPKVMMSRRASGDLTKAMIESARIFPPSKLVKSKNGMIACPVHKDGKERKESMSIQRGFFKCFSCGAHMDSIEYVRLTQGLSFVDAVKMLQGDGR